MADAKISALTAATTPLAGTEVLPIVQSGVTKQVSVANLTAGRAVSANSLTLTGSPLPATSGGTNLTSFTANGIIYASSTSALATNSALTWNGTVLTAAGGGGAKAKLQDNTVLLLNSGAIASGTISFQRSDGTQKAAIASYYNVADEGDLEFIGPTGSTNARLSSAGNFSITSGNLVIGTSGKGIDFSATSQAGGMTSELLADYEEGTWTPTITAAVGTITTVSATGNYTKVGRQVTLNMNIVFTDNGTGSAAVLVSNLPFSAATTRYDAGVGREYSTTGLANTIIFTSTTQLQVVTATNTYPGGTGYKIAASITYNA